jgi:RNA polymerase sigma factor (sigma-70 family)
MDDAALVAAARRGDGSAWAAIYDGYADKLHDHCHRILRDRDEASDALHDAFLAAARHIEQLRDPSRLRPWLYSICRHEALRRLRQRDRVELTDDVDEMISVDPELERGTRSAELQELVWAAAAGLNPRDQALLDLNLRQGLEGQDLADAMGTTLDNSYVMLSRLRDQVERALGALLVARLGRKDCEELNQILEGWDGKLSPLIRKRVARHVDRCELCRTRRAAVASPLALLGAAPLVPAPPLLRDRVLGGLVSDREGAPVEFTADGFAVPEPEPPRPRPPWWVVGAAALVLLIFVGSLLVILADDESTPVVAIGTTTTATDPTSTTDATTTTVPVTTTTTAELTTPTTAPGGPTSTTQPAVTPPVDTLAPRISSVGSEHPEIYIATPTCTPNPKTSGITAEVRGADSVALIWSGVVPDGLAPMNRVGSTTWTSTLGPFPQSNGGRITFTVVAVDAAGNDATKAGTIDLLPCPG